ncbi:MAG: aspartate aminotransferase family protein [Pigmentiphaga sp.]
MHPNDAPSPLFSLPTPTQLDAYWMPFTGNRQFRQDPRILVEAEGCHYRDAHGRRIFDGLSGLWTCGLGHGHPGIVQAVARQATKLDYAPAFQFGHPVAFELAEQLVQVMPAGLDHVFFVGSGSEAVDTSLKMARAYWRLRGHAAKTRFVGRAKGYHGVNFGGISVGGIAGNRKLYGEGISAAHLPHTLLPENAFSRGVPEHGLELADQLLDLIALHDASTIAAVIVEPFAGSAGVIVPPPGYLQRLREICAQHDILLIFDEVITAFGRLGTWTGAEAFGVTPDLLTFAKQVTNGVVPLAGVVASRAIHQAFMDAGGPAHGVEFPHGHTYSAHPIACAAAQATLQALQQEDALQRVLSLAPHFESAVHQLRDAPHVLDIRNIGLAAGITLAAKDGDPTLRPFEVAMRCWEQGLYLRYSGDTLQLAPPFVAKATQIDHMIEILSKALAQQT